MSTVWLLQACGHMRLLPFWCTLSVYYISMHQFTVLFKATYIWWMCVQLQPATYTFGRMTGDIFCATAATWGGMHTEIRVSTESWLWRRNSEEKPSSQQQQWKWSRKKKHCKENMWSFFWSLNTIQKVVLNIFFTLIHADTARIWTDQTSLWN